MRKSAGFIVVALLLVPALAFAWTTGITVQGPATGQSVNSVVAGGKTVKGGTTYVYSASTVDPLVATVNTGSGYNATVTLNGAPASPTVAGGNLYNIAQASIQNFRVVYAAAKYNVTVTPPTNGSIKLSIGNASSMSGFSNVAANSWVTVTANPKTNYTLSGITVNGAAATLSGNTTSFQVAGNTTVAATFSAVPFVNSTLTAPVTALTGAAITATVSASSNVTVTYNVSVTGPAGFVAPAASATNTLTFTPSVAGDYTVTSVATAGSASSTKSAVITVTSATSSANGICLGCHNSSTPAIIAAYNTNQHPVSGIPSGLACTQCHTSAPHSPGGCIGCHSIGQQVAGTIPGGFVNDNNGVRAITEEFRKWSHHVTGVELQNAHCAACHLEGTVVDGVVVVDNAKHMADAKVHLRNADTDADMQWDPANPTHATMDNFCMSCHDSNGATSAQSALIQGVIVPAAGKTASATNPFGDTISNRYDKMQRPAVVDASGQFNTTNNSHHAVKGKRYTGRTRTAGARSINSATFANNSSATLFGARSTIYDAGNFNALYTPLGVAYAKPATVATSLGDDSTLHCGDCHTVGQWKPGVATNAAGDLNTVAIGAHGSNNEYLLRNSIGTDQRHTQSAYTVASGVVTLTNPNGAFLVCYNCHAFNKYGSAFNATGTNGPLGGPHAGEYAVQGRCNGAGNTLSFNGYTTGSATDGTQFETRFAMNPPKSGEPGYAGYAGEQNPDFGNVLGIQCANCHNSGAGNAYGGIHGSANNQTLEGYTNDPSVTGGSFIDGMGNTSKIMRFLPGLGNVMYVPGTLGGMVSGKAGTQAQFKNYSAYAFQKYSAIGGTGTNKRVVRGYSPANYFEMPVRDNRLAVNPAHTAGTQNASVVGSYNFQTGGVISDTNWEQKGWKQSGPMSTTDANQQQAVGAGCYTLGEAAAATPGTVFAQTGKVDQTGATIANRPAIMEELKGPSQDGGATTPLMIENWGGCDDHGAPLGGGNHGFIKRIVRPVTY